MILIALILVILSVAASISVYPEKFSNLKLSFPRLAQVCLSFGCYIFMRQCDGGSFIYIRPKMYLADIYAKRSLAETSVDAK